MVSFIFFTVTYVQIINHYLGAGGLGTGMDMSEFVETRFAVEFSPSAAKTYK